MWKYKVGSGHVFFLGSEEAEESFQSLWILVKL